MLNIKVRNVNRALVEGVVRISMDGVEVTSRGMKTIEYPEPVCTTYLNPRERVLFCPNRDANPFFHFMESLWILAGRYDVEWLSKFNSNIHSYSDDGKVFHAPYGYRMRRQFGIDQVQSIIDLLKDKPDTRQAVIAIWSPDLDLYVASKDIPCNDTIFFKIREGCLNMTVCCRSNDMLWGAYGANVVHFSILQEYIANSIGVPVGIYNQISDSFHVYLDGPGKECWNRVRQHGAYDDNTYDTIQPWPYIMRDADTWNEELTMFMDNPYYSEYIEPYFRTVAVPMFKAWEQYKSGNLPGAVNMSKTIEAEDWKKACTEWLIRRIK